MNISRSIRLILPVCIFFISLFSALPLQAQLDPEQGVPAELKAWVPWVKARHPEWNCARVLPVESKDGEEKGAASRECVWLGASRFTIGEHRAEFVLQGELLDRGTVPLPSGHGIRPGNLKVVRDGAPMESYVVAETDEQLQIVLPKGAYSISGEFNFDALPEQIPVPSEYGIVDIRLDLPRMAAGEPAALAYRDADSIRISQESHEEGSDSVEGRLWRAVVDSSPLRITTKISLNVSGKPRTINLGKILPEHSILISSTSGSPISFSDAGELSMQVFQGQHDLELESVLAQPVSRIALFQTSDEYLPDEEIWIWNGNPELRTVEIENVRTLNANQVELPTGWAAPSVFAVSRGSEVALKELRRGQEIARKNELTLQRSIWPVVDGSALTVDDYLSGTMNSVFRLNALPDLALGSATIGGVPIPVTLDAKTGAPGVELRSQSVSLKALSQISIPRVFSATISSGGWDTVLENIQFNIAIPPSWKLVHVANATTQFGTWTSYWSIFDLFILLVIGVFSFKILGARIGALFTILVLLGKGEFMLPATFFGWTLFFAACSLLLSEKSYSMLRAACGAGLVSSLGAFLLQSLIFSKLQLMQAIHPQLQAGTRYRTITQDIFALIAGSPFFWPLFLFGFIAFVLAMLWVMKGKFIIQKFGRFIVASIGLFFLTSMLGGVGAFLNGAGIGYVPQGASVHYSDGRMAEQSVELSGTAAVQTMESVIGSVDESYSVRKGVPRPKRMHVPQQAPVSSRELQSGPSLPAWKWRTAFATVAGPVGADHSITLYFVPASIERIVCLIRLTLTVLLAFFLISTIARSFSSSLKVLVPSPKAASAALALLFCVAPLRAQAEYPDSTLLGELERRVADDQCSEQACASTDSLSLELSGDTFVAALRVRSRGVSAVRLPGPVFSIIPLRIMLDGKETVAARLDDQFLQVKVPDGSHDIVVQGVIEPSGSLALVIPEKPLRFTHRLTGWKLAAPAANNSVPDEVRFVKESAGEKDPAGDRKKGVVPTRDVFRVTRQVTVDERAIVAGTVDRLGDVSRATTARVPLMQGENSSSANLPVENGAIVIGFAAGQRAASFTSSIANPSEFTLKASPEGMVFDEWSVRCKDYVQCDSEGLAPTKRIIDGQNALLFMPFKGESITLRSKLLESAKGEHMTIDNLSHTNSWGETTLKGKVELSVRATKQAPLILSFADSGLMIDAALVDNVSESRKFSPESVSLLIEPGAHRVTVDYSKPFQPNTVEYVPALTVNFQAGNITTVVRPSPSRWILWVGGGSWGPAGVFWSKLIVIVILVLVVKIGARVAFSWFTLVVLAVAVSFMPTMFQAIPVLWVVYLSTPKIREVIHRYLGARQLQILVSGLAIASVVLLYLVIRVGLLGEPPSLITGNGSNSSMLRWFADFVALRDGARMPTPWIVSLPMTYWRTVTLLLSVALVFLGLKWIRQTVSLLREDQAE